MSAQIIHLEARSPSVSVVHVTPAMAEQWLGKNTQNRGLKKGSIAKMARDLKQGAFLLNGETIKFDTSGRMLDGQNRCHSIILANVSADVFVATGLPPEVMGTIDSGDKRKFSDLLQIRGETGTYSIAAIARRGYMWDQGSQSNTGKIVPSHTEMDGWLTDNPNAIIGAQLASRLGGLKVLPPSIIGLCYVLFSRLDPEQAEYFLEHTAHDAEYFLEHGADTADLRSAQPAFSLRKKVKALRATGGRVNETTALAFTILAWNSWRKGNDRNVYRMPKSGWGDSFPEPK